jgi:hypothetical protein
MKSLLHAVSIGVLCQPRRSYIVITCLLLWLPEGPAVGLAATVESSISRLIQYPIICALLNSLLFPLSLQGQYLQSSHDIVVMRKMWVLAAWDPWKEDCC